MSEEVIGKKLESVNSWEHFLIYKFSKDLIAIEYFVVGERTTRAFLNKVKFRKTYYTCRATGQRLENKEGFIGSKGKCRRLRFSLEAIENLFKNDTISAVQSELDI